MTGLLAEQSARADPGGDQDPSGGHVADAQQGVAGRGARDGGVGSPVLRASPGCLPDRSHDAHQRTAADGLAVGLRAPAYAEDELRDTAALGQTDCRGLSQRTTLKSQFIDKSTLFLTELRSS